VSKTSQRPPGFEYGSDSPLLAKSARNGAPTSEELFCEQIPLRTLADRFPPETMVNVREGVGKMLAEFTEKLEPSLRRRKFEIGYRLRTATACRLGLSLKIKAAERGEKRSRLQMQFR